MATNADAQTSSVTLIAATGSQDRSAAGAMPPR
jgi:hypothetical protein